MNDDALDTLLRTPLSPVADSGFSLRLARRTADARERRRLWETAALLIALGIFLAALVLTGHGAAIEKLSLDLANSLPVAVAGAALVLTLLFARSGRAV